MLVDVNGNPLPSTVSLPPDGDGIQVFAELDGVPLSVYWTLTSAGCRSTNPQGTATFGSFRGQFYFGALVGFTSSAPVTSMSIGPQPSAQYVPPPPRLVSAPVHAVLTATNGAFTRQLQIVVPVLVTNEYA